ncbi:DUF2569 domain-containing protein [Sphingomicrobium sp. XHP0235]|uniref:DUF2569 domain-containing protein n=1 Tax=Sphingomicrobium aquimarinum TaxID=3133971 RepID=UPI0031FEAF71
MFAAHFHRLSLRAAALHAALRDNLGTVMLAWVAIAMLGTAARLAVGPVGGSTIELKTLTPYFLVIGAPLASMALALHWFRDGNPLPQPAIRFARAGKWRTVEAAEARAHTLYGPTGLMVSLLVGMLMNLPFRAGEYFLAIPAVSGALPAWLATLHFMMTLDVVLLSSLYVIAFVAALRKVPLFPRILVTVWAIDLTMQLVIAAMVSANPLPPGVGEALLPMLDANVKKVLISVALWTPYLLLSTRVNVTYRHRLPA